MLTLELKLSNFYFVMFMYRSSIAALSVHL